MNKILIFLLTFNVFAVDLKISIEADEVIIDKNTNISTYSGNVFMQQGDIELFGEVIKITPDEDKNYQILALGKDKKQAQFINKTEKINAKADKVLYITKQEFIQLIGNAKLSQDGNDFAGEKINYNTQKNQVLMQGDKNKRVKLRIKL